MFKIHSKHSSKANQEPGKQCNLKAVPDRSELAAQRANEATTTPKIRTERASVPLAASFAVQTHDQQNAMPSWEPRFGSAMQSNELRGC